MSDEKFELETKLSIWQNVSQTNELLSDPRMGELAKDKGWKLWPCQARMLMLANKPGLIAT